MAKEVGQAGTWGPGKNVMNEIHVKDVASALLCVLKAALERRADEGADGLCTCSLKVIISFATDRAGHRLCSSQANDQHARYKLSHWRCKFCAFFCHVELMSVAETC